MTLHNIAEDFSVEIPRGWQIAPTFWLWVEDFIAALGFMVFVGSAWILTAVVQAALPG